MTTDRTTAYMILLRHVQCSTIIGRRF